VSVESVVYGALIVIAIVFAMSRLGVRILPWREGLFGMLAGVALWLILRLAGLDNFWSTTLGFFVGASVLGIWRRLVRPRVTGTSAQRI
jgi:ribosomal protein S5